MRIIFARKLFVTAMAMGLVGGVQAAPNLDGQDGYIKMPNALTGTDGTWSWGNSFDRPYSTTWTSVSFLPVVQAGFRYVGVIGVPGFTEEPYKSEYGRYKDKVFDVKIQLLPESRYLPAIAFGRLDLFGTNLWRADYIAMTKNFGSLEASLGYGSGLIDKAFGGLRWTPERFPSWSLVGEYDAHNYQKDFNSASTFASQRKKGVSTGIEYRWGWLSTQVAHQNATNSINFMVNIPLNEREFVPKFQEPGFYSPSELPTRPSAAQWQEDDSYQIKLAKALQKQDYALVSSSYANGTLSLNLTNTRISNVGRSVGRAVRTALYFMPLETKAIKVTHTEMSMPVVTYEFFNLPKLQEYLAGKINREQFNQYVLVRSADSSDLIVQDDQTATAIAAGLQEGIDFNVVSSEDGDIVQLRSRDSLLNRIKIAPKVSFFFNDPSGAYLYDLKAVANYDRRLGSGLYFNSEVGATIATNNTKNMKASNSLLPHVRSDVAEYINGSRVKIDQAVVNQFFKPGTDWYGRFSAGIYEEMFAGSGGQLLYSPAGKRWSADLSIDALRQRDIYGGLGFRHYDTLQTLLSVHYRLPYDMTATARAGQFLAKDEGLRFELKRRFRSGIEIGAWYTYTNAHDITSPGSPNSPYQDKGVFFSIPLGPMLTMDNRSVGNFALSPWSRDGGQMVASPGDLYGIVENSQRDASRFDGLGNFSERNDEINHPANANPIETFQPWPAVKLRLDDSVNEFPELSPLVQGSLLATGAIGIAALSDSRWDSLMKHGQHNRLLKYWGDGASAAPVIGAGLAGMAMAFGDERLQNTGFIALQAAAVSVAGNMAIKQVVNRARPGDGNGAWSTQPAGESRSSSSFASTHAAANFALVTPFASEYDAPWLYGVAAVASLGRTANRQHWLSDVVAGGLGGFAVGKWLWSSQRDASRYQTMFGLAPNSASITVQKSY
ncbi:YjbH domain-containing protein [Aquitalea magnusonii]|uniref:Membrane-associated phospholipid phosphatase n=1 Tax=Aquitalea magnusonii TaxID=332411 RepID=A0A318J3J6_9NEIS|nr:YjbH domain-containing protein [Aquitalea magnusonii]PXX41713.1 membrane-associated phospholipid phosphatase [Aquitalea magnusonii]